MKNLRKLRCKTEGVFYKYDYSTLLWNHLVTVSDKTEFYRTEYRINGVHVHCLMFYFIRLCKYATDGITIFLLFSATQKNVKDTIWHVSDAKLCYWRLPPAAPCGPGAPGRPSLLRPGGPGGPTKLWLSSLSCSKTFMYILVKNSTLSQHHYPLREKAA